MLNDLPPAPSSSSASPRWPAGASPLTLLRAAMWTVLALLVTRTLADADLWGHLRFGLDMIASKSLHAVDPYSFTSDVPWVNHEWLAELLMGFAYTVSGAPGLILLKLGVIGVIAGVLLLVAREEGADSFARDAFVALAIFATYTRTQVVRPQMFSVAIFFVLLYLLRQSGRGRPNALWAIPPCFAAWVNLHGGWIVGLAALGAWMAGDLWQRRNGRRAALLACVGTLSVLATLLNPYGYGLWQFIAETVRAERADITDWTPLLGLPASVLAIEAVLPAIALAAVWTRGGAARRLPARDLAVLAVLAVATVRVGRVDAFLQAAIALLLCTHIIGFFSGLDLKVRASVLRPSVPVGVLTLALAAFAAVGSARNLGAVRVEGAWIPDRAAAALLREARPGARVLTWFDWGEYALWQLSPAGILISMDGRRETVYSERTIRDHFHFYQGRRDMVDYPDRIGADHVWLPSRLPIVPRLAERGWVTVLDTGRSVVLARAGGTLEPRGTPAPSSGGFPWP